MNETIAAINEYLAIHWTNSHKVVKFNTIPDDIEPMGYSSAMRLNGCSMGEVDGYFYYVSLGDSCPTKDEEIERRKRNGTWGCAYCPPPAEIPEKFKDTIWDREPNQKSFAEKMIEKIWD